MKSLHALPRHSLAGLNLEGMRPSTNTIPTTHSKYKHHHRLATEYEWNGETLLAEKHRQMADHYKKRHLQGDLYDPNF